jgi:hypothetical protein
MAKVLVRQLKPTGRPSRSDPADEELLNTSGALDFHTNRGKGKVRPSLTSTAIVQ